MPNLTATPGWGSVMEWDLITPLLGGPGGPLNVQAQSLLNRIVTRDIANVAALRAVAPPSTAEIAGLKGYSAADDGGGGLFVWVPSSTKADNGGTVIMPNSAPATGRWERDAEHIPAMWFGVSASDTTRFQAFVDACAGKVGVLKSGVVYPVSTALQINSDTELVSDGPKPAYIDTAANSGIAIQIGGAITPAVTTTLAANVSVNSRKIQLTNAAGIQPGMLIKLQSTKAWYHDARIHSSITPESDGSGTARGGTTNTMQLKAGTTFTNFTGLAVTITGGTGAGQSRVVGGYNSSNQTLTGMGWTTPPDATSTYTFPQLFKGELHLVRSVSGNIVELDVPTMDGYDVVDDAEGNRMETVTVTAYTPLRARLANIHIRRPPTLNANSFGVDASYCLDLVLDRIGVDYGQATGISLNSCYRTRILSPNIKGANDETTGYGVQDDSGSFNYVIGGAFFGCRRGVDFSGTIPSSYGMVAFATVTGGGVQEDGVSYTPVGAVENFGLGSHGTARGTTYYKNKITGVSRGINLRGRNLKVVGNEFFGAIGLCCIDLSYGCNVTIDSNHYYNQYSEGSLPSTSGQIETNDFTGSNINTTQAPHFIRVQANWERGATDVLRNVARNLNRYFLFFETGSATFHDFTLHGNLARFEPNANSLECGLVGVDSGSLNLLNFEDMNNSIRGSDSITSLRRFGAGVSINGVAGGANSRAGAIFTETMLVDNDAVGKVRVGRTGTLLTFMLTAGTSVTNRFLGTITANSATLTTMGSANNIAGIATVPTGASGADDQVNVHFDGEFLYIENRSGVGRDFFVTIFPGE